MVAPGAMRVKFFGVGKQGSYAESSGFPQKRTRLDGIVSTLHFFLFSGSSDTIISPDCQHAVSLAS
jgi:hypothetical protein